MKTIDDYCDIAKRELGLKSDRELSKALNLTSSNVTSYRTKRAWPSPSTVARLAKLAKDDPKEAIINLLIWKEDDHETRAILIEMLKSLTPIIIILAVIIAPFATAYASISPNFDKIPQYHQSHSLYYG